VRKALPLLLFAGLGLLANPLDAGAENSQWRRGWGLGQAAQHVRSPASSGFADLQLQPQSGGHAVIARNLLAGPVQIRLHGGESPTVTPPQLLASGEQRRLAWLPANGPGAQLLLDAVPGDPAAQPLDVLYRLPFESGKVRVSQAFGGRRSHADVQNHYAVDFPLPESTPVIAARAGTVMQVFDAATGEANLVRVLHADGSMALYAHLQAGSAVIRPGQALEAGQRLANSGNTGFSSGPHLHFAVQRNAGMVLESLPFRMADARGELHFPLESAAGSE
jgi:murein DD-endopeptidase MepM/ murein hydrolase activator NlpD